MRRGFTILSHITEKLLWGTHPYFRRFLVSKNLSVIGGTRFSVVKFLFHSTGKLRNGTFLCFRKFPVSIKFMDKRGGGYQDFPSKIFCLIVPKNFVGEPFRVSLISGSEKFYASESYVTMFCRNFLSHSAEKFCSWTLLCCVSENFRWRKSLWIRGGGGGEFQDFLSKIFCLIVPKNFVGEPFRVSLISGIEKVWIRAGGGGGAYHDFPSNFFVSQCWNLL